MTINTLLMELARKHVRFCGGGYCDLLRFNQRTGTIKNGNTVLVKNWKVVVQEVRLKDGSTYKVDDTFERSVSFEELEELYGRYYTSVPDRHTDYVRSNFVAKTFNELTHDELVDGIKRQEAMYALELAVMQTSAEWPEPNHWYYQGKENSNMIIYREWFERRK